MLTLCKHSVCLTQCYHRVNPIDRLSARFENIKLIYTPANLLQLNLNTKTECVNSCVTRIGWAPLQTYWYVAPGGKIIIGNLWHLE